MDQQGRMEEKTLGTERCENTNTLYTNQIIIIHSLIGSVVIRSRVRLYVERDPPSLVRTIG